MSKLDLNLSERLRLISSLRQHVETQTSFGPRHIGRAKAMEAVASFIEHKLGLGDFVKRQTYAAAEGQFVSNLIIERRGISRPKEIVILGAHYDTDANSGTPGADDNASAVAVLLEVARLLHGRYFHRTIRFVAFACEEHPHFSNGTMGSGVYARRCKQEGDDIVGMLCLEMVGYYSNKPGSQRILSSIPKLARWIFPDKGNFLAAVGNLNSKMLSWKFRRGFKKWTNFPLFSIALPEQISEIKLSDHRSFWEQGYPALMLTDTSFLRNPNYHKKTDTPDTLDYDRMADVTIGVAGGVSRLANEFLSFHPAPGRAIRGQ